MKNKKAFTLIELSIVIVIVAIILSTILISKILVDSVKINKIQEEFRMFNVNINLFFDRYGCFPGDCTSYQVRDLLLANLNPACTTVVTTVGPTATPLNTGSIETVTKRTCMMYELQLAGYINTIMPTYGSLTDSIAGKNIPYAKFSRQAAWDFRITGPAVISTSLSYVFNNVSGNFYLPLEFNSMLPSDWGAQHILVLRDANTVTGLNSDITLAPTVYGGPSYAISAMLTKKLDSKFDDGMPYTGNIRGGLNINNDLILLENPSGGSCNNANFYPLTQLPIPASYASSTYLSSKNIQNGCLLGFFINMPI